MNNNPLRALQNAAIEGVSHSDLLLIFQRIHQRAVAMAIVKLAHFDAAEGLTVFHRPNQSAQIKIVQNDDSWNFVKQFGHVTVEGRITEVIEHGAVAINIVA